MSESTWILSGLRFETVIAYERLAANVALLPTRAPRNDLVQTLMLAVTAERERAA